MRGCVDCGSDLPAIIPCDASGRFSKSEYPRRPFAMHSPVQQPVMRWERHSGTDSAIDNCEGCDGGRWDSSARAYSEQADGSERHILFRHAGLACMRCVLLCERPNAQPFNRRTRSSGRSNNILNRALQQVFLKMDGAKGSAEVVPKRVHSVTTLPGGYGSPVFRNDSPLLAIAIQK
jgi:hypothetical protein